MSNLKNVEALNRLIGLCTGYGGTYVPGSPNLRVERLSELLTQARAALQQVSAAKTDFKSATNQREMAFAQVRQLVSRAVAELKSSGALSQTVADATSMLRKIKGRVRAERPGVPAEVKPTVDRKEVKRPRVNGSGYDSVAYHFEKLIETLTDEPQYNPTVDDLKITGLKQALSRLHEANQSVATAYGALSQARINRNELLYKGKSSVYGTAQAVKQQVRALFGYSSPAAAQASRVKVTTIN